MEKFSLARQRAKDADGIVNGIELDPTALLGIVLFRSALYARTFCPNTDN